MPYIEVILVLLLILLNGLLAMSELAIASSRAAKLRAMVERNVNGARRAMVLASNPGRFLSRSRSHTLIGILAGAFSGATLAEDYPMADYTCLSEKVADPSVCLVSLITYLSLILGELVPKQIALRNPERIACLVAPAYILAKVSAPLVWLLDHSVRVWCSWVSTG